MAGGALAVTATIVANGTSGDCVGGITDGGHNLIGDAESTWGLTNGVKGRIVGVDPMLDAENLKDNGGPTQTIALLADGPAVGAGDPEIRANAPANGVAQRGYGRFTTFSIGPFEYGSSGPPMPTSTPTSAMTPTNTSTRTARARPSENERGCSAPQRQCLVAARVHDGPLAGRGDGRWGREWR